MIKNYKHPLEHTWYFYYNDNNNMNQNTWVSNQKCVYSFSYIEDFWCLYNFIKVPTELKDGSDYLLFKNNIKPMWEDDNNINGGKWIINSIWRLIDDIWLNILLSLIGETLDDSDEITGVILNVRSNKYKLGIWTRNFNNTNKVIEIGLKIRKIINIPPEITIGYQKHKEKKSLHIL